MSSAHRLAGRTRASEFCCITLPQLQTMHNKKPVIRIIGKGGYKGELFLSEELVKEIEFYLENVRTPILKTKGIESDAFLVGINGQPMNRIKLWQRFQTICKQAGLKPKGIHSTRHSVGVMLLDKFNNIELVRERLRHRSITTTTVYAKCLDRKQQAASAELAKVFE